MSLKWLENKSRYITVFMAGVSLLATLSTGLLWIDTRYMHKNMAASQYIELQLIVYERALQYYERKIDKEGYKPTTEETREYNLLVATVEALSNKRNEELGLK